MEPREELVEVFLVDFSGKAVGFWPVSEPIAPRFITLDVVVFHGEPPVDGQASDREVPVREHCLFLQDVFSDPVFRFIVCQSAASNQERSNSGRDVLSQLPEHMPQFSDFSNVMAELLEFPVYT